MAREHQQASCDQVLASAGLVGKPPTPDSARAFDADIVAALCHLTEMIDQKVAVRAVWR
jgi:hypothetical protein